MKADRADRAGAYSVKGHPQDLPLLLKAGTLHKVTRKVIYTTWWHRNNLRTNNILRDSQMGMIWTQACSTKIITTSATMSLWSNFARIVTCSTRESFGGWSRRWETLLKTVIISSKTTIKLSEASSLLALPKSSRYLTISRTCYSREKKV